MENIKESMERKLDIAKLKLMNFLNFSICFLNFFSFGAQLAKENLSVASRVTILDRIEFINLSVIQ